MLHWRSASRSSAATPRAAMLGYGEPMLKGKRRPFLATEKRLLVAIIVMAVVMGSWVLFLQAEIPEEGFPEVNNNRILWSRGWSVAADLPHKDSKYYALHSVARATTEEMEKTYLDSLISLAAHGEQRPVVVWVRTKDLPTFGEDIVPRLEEIGDLPPIILVSTDGYYTMPDDLHDPKAMSQILKAPFIRKWYTQNLNRASLQGCCEAEQAKLVPIPMGVDFHSNTVAKSTRFFWTIALKYLGYRIHWSYSVWADRGRQMQLLETAKERALPPGERKNAVWSDVHLKHYASRFGDPRQALAEALEARKSDRGSLPIPVDAAEGRVSQKELWEKYASYRYVVGALGMGMDCHRTWEVLHLGAVLVTLHSPLDELYEAIRAPVILLESWDQLFDANFLEAEYQKVRNRLPCSLAYNPLPPWPQRTAEHLSQPLIVNLAERLQQPQMGDMQADGAQATELRQS